MEYNTLDAFSMARWIPPRYPPQLQPKYPIHWRRYPFGLQVVDGSVQVLRHDDMVFIEYRVVGQI